MYVSSSHGGHLAEHRAPKNGFNDHLTDLLIVYFAHFITIINEVDRTQKRVPQAGGEQEKQDVPSITSDGCHDKKNVNYTKTSNYFNAQFINHCY